MKSDGTYDYYRYHLTVIGRTSNIFSLKACHDGHVGLAEVVGLSSLTMYEIVIGGWQNSKSVIRRARQGTIEVEASTPNILDCNSARNFWLSWEDGVIQFGTGGIVGQTRILSYTDPNPYTVNSLTVATAEGQIGDWRFFSGQGCFKKEILP